MTRETDPRRRRPLAVIICGHLALASWFSWMCYPIGETRSVENDFFAWYLPNAAHILSGRPFAIEEFNYNPAGYSILLAGMGWLTRDLYLAGKIISIIASGAALLLIFSLMARILDPEAALWVTLLTAANRYFFLASYYVGTDMVFLALCCLALRVFMGPREPPMRWALLAGACSAAAYWTRYNGIFLAPLFFAVTWLWLPGPARQKISCLGGYCAAFAVAAAPWHLFLWSKKGRFFFNRNYFNAAYDLLHASEVKDSFSHFTADRYQSMWDVVAASPAGFFAAAGANFFTHMRDIFSVLAPPWFGLLCALGLALFLRDLKNDAAGHGKCFALACACYLGLMSLIHFEPRYFLLLAPLLALSFYYGWRALAARLPRRRAAAVAALGAVCALAAGDAASFHYRLRDNFNVEIVRIGDFMKYFAAPGERLLSRSANIAWFSGLRFVFFPVIAETSGLAGLARKEGADWLFYSEIETPMRPHMAGLAFNARPPGLVKVMDWRPLRSKAAVFRVLPEGAEAEAMFYNRASFDDASWQKLQRAQRDAAPGMITLEGVLLIQKTGTHRLAFSADRFRILFDHKPALSDRGAEASFVSVALPLREGAARVQIEWMPSPGSVVPPGLFWQAPGGEKEPVPFSVLRFTRVTAG